MIIGFLIEALPAIAVLCALLYAPYGLIITKKYGRQTYICHAVKYVFLGCCFSLLYLTVLYYYPNIEFFPGYYMYNLCPFVWVFEVYSMGVKKMAEQLILNVVMFIPFGLSLPMAARRARSFWVTAAITLGTTVTIETLQLFMGRSADIDDVIMNFLGGILGYLLFMLLRRAFSDRAWWDKMSLNEK